ncbi:MAG: M67 family metallopeptidase [Hydrogenothermaceae bacterium]|nr:M67 family metallopeptidase [Hydrogenothermaceae bacterium]
MLILNSSLLEQIKTQSEKGYPFEICGFMVGKVDYQSSNIREVFEVVQVENQNRERANDRFEISPKDYMRVEQLADSKGLQIVGVYHSHPDHPDRPSQTDLEYAVEDISYIILSVKGGKVESFRSWYLVEGEFQEEEVKIV